MFEPDAQHRVCQRNLPMWGALLESTGLHLLLLGLTYGLCFIVKFLEAVPETQICQIQVDSLWEKGIRAPVASKCIPWTVSH